MGEFAKSIIIDMNNWTGGWITWNAALNHEGGPNWRDNSCFAEVMIHSEDGTIYYTPQFYVMQHFSRYLRPGGFVRASSGGDNAGLMTLAAQNVDGTLAVVVYNDTDGEVDYRVTYMGQGVDATIPPLALQTIEFK